MPVEDSEKSVLLLRREVGRLSNGLDRARAGGAVWPVLTVAVLMLFWPTFNPAGDPSADSSPPVDYPADSEPVTVTGLWRAVSDSDLGLLTLLASSTVILHLVLIVGLAVLLGREPTTSVRVVQLVSLLLAVSYVALAAMVRQNDGSGGAGQEGYQPGGSWLLMLALVAAAATVAAWVRSVPD
jgi:hypothetical protein